MHPDYLYYPMDAIKQVKVSKINAMQTGSFELLSKTRKTFFLIDNKLLCVEKVVRILMCGIERASE